MQLPARGPRAKPQDPAQLGPVVAKRGLQSQRDLLHLEAQLQPLTNCVAQIAYQLAVITDDIHQGITHVVRGDDLLEVTFNQLILFEALNYPAPQFTHIPVLLDDRGYKLSKQHGSPGIDPNTPQVNIYTCLQRMGFSPPKNLGINELLAWGVDAWHVKYVKV